MLDVIIGRWVAQKHDVNLLFYIVTWVWTIPLIMKDWTSHYRWLSFVFDQIHVVSQAAPKLPLQIEDASRPETDEVSMSIIFTLLKFTSIVIWYWWSLNLRRIFESWALGLGSRPRQISWTFYLICVLDWMIGWFWHTQSFKFQKGRS